MASEVYPSLAARATSSSGCEAPRRKLKHVTQCSSAYAERIEKILASYAKKPCRNQPGSSSSALIRAR